MWLSIRWEVSVSERLCCRLSCLTCQLHVGIIIQSRANYTEGRAGPHLAWLTPSFWVPACPCVTSTSTRSRRGPVSHRRYFLAPSSSIIKANGARYFEPAIWTPLISDLKTIAGDWATQSGHLQWPGEFSWEAKPSIAPTFHDPAVSSAVRSRFMQLFVTCF